MNRENRSAFGKMSGPLKSFRVERIQVNLGRLCNLSCNHCHLAASPEAEDIMPWPVMQEILKVIDRKDNGIKSIDITGGAPELNPNVRALIEQLCLRNMNVLLRTNLVALLEPGQEDLAEYLFACKVNLAASLPCYMEENIRVQRGGTVFEKSIAALKKLNRLGYGEETQPALDLVYNPGGPFLPGDQEELESLYRYEMKKRYGLSFSRLLVLTNMPIGRFKELLIVNGGLNDYLLLLKQAYNRGNLSQLMCRNQVSMGWDGRLYDCDFNLALDLPIDAGDTHITGFNSQALSSRHIITGDHCFGCTAGAGSSCGGSLKASG